MIAASLTHSWRVSVAVALGVTTATAVIAGALLVGDSMRGSLRALTIERLGKTESVVIPGGFFQSEGIVSDDVDVVPLILFTTGIVESQGDVSQPGLVKRAGSVQIIGCDDNFWTLDATGVIPKQLPQGERVVLNQTTADELGVEIGDMVTLRLPVEQAVPADSPLGRRDIQSEGLPRMEVVDILPDRGLGRFAISANQATAQNIFVSRETIAEALDREGQANALLFDQAVASDQLNVRLADLGLQLDRITRDLCRGRSDDDRFRLLLADQRSIAAARSRRGKNHGGFAQRQRDACEHLSGQCDRAVRRRWPDRRVGSLQHDLGDRLHRAHCRWIISSARPMRRRRNEFRW